MFKQEHTQKDGSGIVTKALDLHLQRYLILDEQLS